MARTNEQLKQDFQQMAQQLRTLRDEIRLKIHLGGMDARDAWHRLEPEVEDLVSQARKVSEDSLKRAREALDRSRNLKSDLDQEQGGTHPH